MGERGRRGKEGNRIVVEVGRRREEEWKVAFWNVTELGNKDKEFWEGLREWDVLVITETWVNEKGWVKIRERLPREFEWAVQMAKRKSRKGRVMEGMVMGMRRTPSG